MVFPLRKRMTLPPGNHCRSLFAPPSVVNCLRSEPSGFMSQISLLATNATLSAPPGADAEGWTGSVGASVGAEGVSVLVGSVITTGTCVEASVGADVSGFKGMEVKVLAGTCVFAGPKPPLNKNKPTATTA